MHFRLIENASAESSFPTKIKVVGVGGGGSNAINRMIEDGVDHVEFIAVNTDLQALGTNRAPNKLPLGIKVTGGLGAGGKPEVGERAALEDKDAIKAMLANADMVFITAGMGGGTGTGAAPIIADAARDLDILCVAVITRPFGFEGSRKMQIAEEGLNNLRNSVDTLITISNERLFQVIAKDTGISEAFRFADNVLRQGVQGISDLITREGMINIDFADVRTIMGMQGDALMGIGEGQGEHRIADAVENAIHNPMLEDVGIEGATGLLVNVVGGENFTLSEYQEALDTITKKVDKDALTIVGNGVDKNLHDSVHVTVIATGFAASKDKTEHVATVPHTMSYTQWSELINPNDTSNMRVATIRNRNAGIDHFEKDINIPAVLRLRNREKEQT